MREVSGRCRPVDTDPLGRMTDVLEGSVTTG